MNPNVEKAKKRGNPRPKTENQVSAPADKTLKWVEPLPTPVEIGAEFAMINPNEYAGLFQVRPSLPESIAEPHRHALDGLVYRTTGDQELAARLSMGLTSQCYFKCARKLFNTLEARAQTNLQPLKGVWYDAVEVPVTVARLIDAVGNFDTEFGKFKHKYQITTFLRWLAEGLRHSAQHAEMPAPNPAVDGEPLTWVWDEPDSLKLILDRANEYMQDLCEVTHQITVPGDRPVVIAARLPEYTTENYYNTGLFPPEVRLSWQRTGLLLELTQEHLREVTVPLNTPPATDLTTLLSTIGLAKAPAAWSYSNMKVGFTLFQEWYALNCDRHMHAYFKMTISPAGERGYPAQLASSKGMQVEAILPMSKADLALGYLLNPSERVDFDPLIMAYSKTSARVAMSRVISTQLQDIAH